MEVVSLWKERGEREREREREREEGGGTNKHSEKEKGKLVLDQKNAKKRKWKLESVSWPLLSPHEIWSNSSSLVSLCITSVSRKETVLNRESKKRIQKESTKRIHKKNPQKESKKRIQKKNPKKEVQPGFHDLPLPCSVCYGRYSYQDTNVDAVLKRVCEREMRTWRAWCTFAAHMQYRRMPKEYLPIETGTKKKHGVRGKTTGLYCRCLRSWLTHLRVSRTVPEQTGRQRNCCWGCRPPSALPARCCGEFQVPSGERMWEGEGGYRGVE